jgi:hypothetical protein
MKSKSVAFVLGLLDSENEGAMVLPKSRHQWSEWSEVKSVKHFIIVTYECYCGVCGSIVYIFVLKVFVLYQSSFVLLQSILSYYYYYPPYVFYCFICYACCFVSSVICIVSISTYVYSYYCPCLFVCKCKDQCHRVGTQQQYINK